MLNSYGGTAQMNPWQIECQRLVGSAQATAGIAQETYVITNNHFRGKGVVNALEIKSALAGKKVPGPASLADEYPRIEESVIPT